MLTCIFLRSVVDKKRRDGVLLLITAIWIIATLYLRKHVYASKTQLPKVTHRKRRPVPFISSSCHKYVHEGREYVDHESACGWNRAGRGIIYALSNFVVESAHRLKGFITHEITFRCDTRNSRGHDERSLQHHRLTGIPAWCQGASGTLPLQSQRCRGAHVWEKSLLRTFVSGTWMGKARGICELMKSAAASFLSFWTIT